MTAAVSEIVRPATPADIEAVCRRMRWADRLELRAAGESVGAFRARLLAEPPGTVWYGERSGRPLGLFGCWIRHEGLAAMGVIWAVFTPHVDRHAVFAARVARRFIAESRAECQLVGNYVHVPHVAAQRWLQALGAEFGGPVSHGPRQEPFLPFLFGSVRPRAVNDV